MSDLVLDRVTKSFGGVHAVADVSIRARGGRITGLIGPNGAGKTTVINLVTGMFKLSAGRVLVDSQDISEEEPDVIARSGVSRTFQNIRLLPDATVLENVMIGFHRHERASMLAGVLGLPSARRETEQIRARSLALLDKFELGRHADALAGGLAYGHQRRVEMARAVASEPDILLLDEPVAGMNDVEADELADVFKELAAGGMGLLLVEHNIRFVSRMCDHVYVLASGRLIAEGEPRTVLNDEAVITAYLGKK
ncbi:MAG TPA: ABC transporter ATP-binding protein [Ramlibacter sp.]|nr:ABC transporter ATP-binding protein [Ramlibacter sp.]